MGILGPVHQHHSTVTYLRDDNEEIGNLTNTMTGFDAVCRWADVMGT